MKRLNVTLTREVALQLRMIWLLLFCAPVCLHAQVPLDYSATELRSSVMG